MDADVLIEIIFSFSFSQDQMFVYESVGYDKQI